MTLQHVLNYLALGVLLGVGVVGGICKTVDSWPQ